MFEHFFEHLLVDEALKTPFYRCLKFAELVQIPPSPFAKYIGNALENDGKYQKNGAFLFFCPRKAKLFCERLDHLASLTEVRYGFL